MIVDSNICMTKKMLKNKTKNNDTLALLVKENSSYDYVTGYFYTLKSR